MESHPTCTLPAHPAPHPLLTLTLPRGLCSRPHPEPLGFPRLPQNLLQKQLVPDPMPRVRGEARPQGSCHQLTPCRCPSWDGMEKAEACVLGDGASETTRPSGKTVSAGFTSRQAHQQSVLHEGMNK